MTETQEAFDLARVWLREVPSEKAAETMERLRATEEPDWRELLQTGDRVIVLGWPAEREETVARVYEADRSVRIISSRGPCVCFSMILRPIHVAALAIGDPVG